MPVQINELIVRTIVTPSPQKNVSGTGDTDCNADSESTGMDKSTSGGSAETSELAEKIFEIIREKQER